MLVFPSLPFVPHTGVWSHNWGLFPVPPLLPTSGSDEVWLALAPGCSLEGKSWGLSLFFTFFQPLPSLVLTLSVIMPPWGTALLHL